MVKRFLKRLVSKSALREEGPAIAETSRGWIGVDLDGTLASYDGWYGPAYIGEPIEPMLQRVKEWMAQGVEVRIFTARASVPEYVPYVKLWLKKQGLQSLKVTNVKDFGMICLWDDRCVEVVTNEGVPKTDKI
ncbi:MAG: hypothetical protein K9K86_04145 [Pseudomonadales bacterium]|nr:hypothetical protein [Pseudomonadales bacterium]